MTTITEAEREVLARELFLYRGRSPYEWEGPAASWSAIGRARAAVRHDVNAFLSLGWRPAPVVDDAMVERAAKAWIAFTRGYGPLSLDGWDRTMRDTIRDAITAATRAALLAALTPET